MTHVLIRKPQPGQYVRHKVPLEGTITGATEDTILRTVVVPQTHRFYHPQGGRINIDLDTGKWFGVTYVGSSTFGAHTEEHFRILIVRCNEVAEDSLNGYLETAPRRGWPGLSELPSGCKIFAEVNVIRNDRKAEEVGPPAPIDVREVTESTIAPGSGAAITSRGWITAEREGIAVGRDVKGDTVVVGYDAAFKQVAGAASFVLNELETNQKFTRDQAQWWFHFSLIAAAIGFVLICAGIVAVIWGYVAAGAMTAISSILPSAASALFFVQSKTANERVDVIQDKLTEAREIQAAVEIANAIVDESSRDDLMAEIVRSVLRLGEPKNSLNVRSGG